MRPRRVGLTTLISFLVTSSIPFILPGRWGESPFEATIPVHRAVAQTKNDFLQVKNSGGGSAVSLFNRSTSYRTTIAANGDPADVYYPNPPDLKPGRYSFPIALLLQGANVDKAFYSHFARIVATYGFVVVVPNHFTSVLGMKGLIAQMEQVNDVLAHMVLENSNNTSPVTGILDTKKLVLLGHSWGGAIGMNAIQNLPCNVPNCTSQYSRPKELLAGAFFGSYLKDRSGKILPTKNAGIPLALIGGSIDSSAKPELVWQSYKKIQTPPKTYVLIVGANHYGITNTNNPAGARPDKNSPTLDQDVALETNSPLERTILAG